MCWEITLERELDQCHGTSTGCGCCSSSFRGDKLSLDTIKEIVEELRNNLDHACILRDRVVKRDQEK